LVQTNNGHKSKGALGAEGLTVLSYLSIAVRRQALRCMQVFMTLLMPPVKGGACHSRPRPASASIK
jgi:hypothetical protein